MVRIFNEFDILDYPLDQGKVLIEAAAGSGKTYTIQYLFLRLLLERDDLNIGNILVVTFTEAATEELKARIREILKEAAQLLAKVSQFRSLHPERDGDLGRVLMQALSKGKSVSYLKGRLQLARTTFDEVVIATIHGFCNRILCDYAFECGSRVNLELVKDGRFFIQSVAEDYWRRTFYHGSDALVGAALAQGLTLESLIELGLQRDRDANLVILPESPEGASWTADIDHFTSEIETLKQNFQQNRIRAYDYLVCETEEIERVLFAGTSLKGNSWKPDKYRQYVSDLAATLTSPSWPDKNGVKSLEKFSRSDLITKTKKNQVTPEHPLFKLCEELADTVTRQQESAAQLVCALKRDFLDFAVSPSGLSLYKEKSRKQGYSDYLTGLNQVLQGPAGGLLKHLVAERFKVALVDEFQDTDPLQNSIFNAFFDRPGALFYRIGDPKQSIYGFRGADIYAYLAAAQEQGQELATLDKNYRSTPELLKVFNRIFSIPAPFLLDGINYREMTCGRPFNDQERLLIDGQTGAALHLWYFAGAAGKKLTAGTARYRLYNAVADTCAELLSLACQPLVNDLTGAKPGNHRWRAEIAGSEDGLSFRALRASDIAILTATNKEAAEIWQACQSRRVPAVVAAAENLWQTLEAKEIFLFLEALLAPEKDSLLSSALATFLMGFTAQFLAVVHVDEESSERFEYELWRQAFLSGRELWIERGIMALFAGFPDFSAASANPDENFAFSLNLARSSRGERALTNFYHIQEALHEYECEHQAGPKVLLNWMYEHLTGTANDADEFELRLESEADTVKIMTVHKSKGLEFPVVFAPFLWKKPRSQRALTLFHRPVSATHSGGDVQVEETEISANKNSSVAAVTRFERCLDLSPETDEEHNHAAQAESLAESLRLFYVALTRAKMRLYLAWPQTQDSGKSALMYLRRPPCGDDEIKAFICKGGPLPTPDVIDGDKAETWEDIPEVVREALDFRRTELVVAATALPILKAREFKRQLPAKCGLMSFSNLTAGGHRLQFAEDSGEKKTAAAASLVKSTPPFAGFPGGVATGNAIHKIFEEIDFSRAGENGWQEDQRVLELVQNLLARFDLLKAGSEVENNNRVKAVLAMVDKVLNTPLPGPSGIFKLSQPDITLRREMEFCLPVNGSLTAEHMTSILNPVDSTAFQQLASEKLSRWRLQFPEFLPQQGYLNGFIDLVFCVAGRYYLLDWKTNNLGPDYADYNQRALQQNMLDSDYLLQYHLYLAALNRFLESRLEEYDYESNFGGVFYLYVRGINGVDAETGVFHDRPEYETVSDLTNVICG